MIAVVTSTVKPEIIGRSFYSFQERLNQTRQTLIKLQKFGFNTIYVIDNSISLDQSSLDQLFIDFPTVKFFHIMQYQFHNKGVNELLMLLYLTRYIPGNEHIFKLSGRYYPNQSFIKPNFTDFAVKTYHYNNRNGTISTRGYWIKDVNIMQNFLLKCLNEVFAYPERIVGIRSLYKKLKSSILYKSTPPLNISIEFASANVLKKEKYHLTFMNNIGIEGLVAGADHFENIIE